MSHTAELVSRYDLFMFDLDGVLYVGDQPVPGAATALAKLRGCPVGVVFATNNASRSPEAVARLLESVGVAAAPAEVLTSAKAAAGELALRYPAGSLVLVLGAPALAEAVREAGLVPVWQASDRPVAVVQGYGPGIGWAELAEAHVAIRDGAGWVATNGDRTLPSPRGPLPGNGALVAALTASLGREPDLVVGKPAAGLFTQGVVLTGAQRPLVVGDRLDTDIEGANRAGFDSLLVLTGVCRPADLLVAPPHLRPTYVAEQLDGLFDAPLAITDPCDEGWRAKRAGDLMSLEGEGPLLGALRAMCRSWWQTPASGTRSRNRIQAGTDARVRPATDKLSRGGDPQVRAVGSAAVAAVLELGLVLA